MSNTTGLPVTRPDFDRFLREILPLESGETKLHRLGLLAVTLQILHATRSSLPNGNDATLALNRIYKLGHRVYTGYAKEWKPIFESGSSEHQLERSVMAIARTVGDTALPPSPRRMEAVLDALSEVASPWNASSILADLSQRLGVFLSSFDTWISSLARRDRSEFRSELLDCFSVTTGGDTKGISQDLTKSVELGQYQEMPDTETSAKIPSSDDMLEDEAKNYNNKFNLDAKTAASPESIEFAELFSRMSREKREEVLSQLPLEVSREVYEVLAARFSPTTDLSDATGPKGFDSPQEVVDTIVSFLTQCCVDDIKEVAERASEFYQVRTGSSLTHVSRVNVDELGRHVSAGSNPPSMDTLQEIHKFVKELTDARSELTDKQQQLQSLLDRLAGKQYPTFNDNNQLAKDVNAARDRVRVRLRVRRASDDRAVTVTCVQPAGPEGGYFQAIATTRPRASIFSGPGFPNLEVFL